MLTKYAVNDKTRAGVFRRGVHHHKNIIKISVRDNDQNIISVEIQRFSKNWNNVCWVNDALCMRPLAGVTCQTSSPSPLSPIALFPLSPIGAEDKPWPELAQSQPQAITREGGGGSGGRGGVCSDPRLWAEHLLFSVPRNKPKAWKMKKCLLEKRIQ